MPKPEKQLQEQLVESLQGEKIVYVMTTDAESNRPQLSAVSWLVAGQDGKTVKFAVGHNASSADNISKNPAIVLGVTAAGSCYAIRGKGKVSDIYERTIKLRVVTVQVEEVEDVMFYGGKVTTEPAYEKTYDPALAKKIDDEVYALLKK
jgi:hypothetical protein